MKFDINGVNYNVELKGAGAPLVLLHGFTGDHRTWDNLIHTLSRKYQCIAIDIMGHGKSDSPDQLQYYNIESVAADITAIIRRLNFNEAHFLGYSMGGRLAITIAALYPQYVYSLILESTTPGIESEELREQRRQQDTDLANQILKEGMEWFVSYWENIPLFASQKRLPNNLQEETRLQRLSNSPIGLANSLRGMGTGSQPSWWDKLKDISIPTLLITGSLDEKFCNIAGEMDRILEKCTNIEVSNCGHAIHVEEPEKFGKIVSEFLSYSC